MGCCVPGSVYSTGGGAVRYAEGLCPAGWPLCCDFVVHHCPCLMEAWLFLSRCCDNAKCPFYEREGFRPPSLLSTPHPSPRPPYLPSQTHTNSLSTAAQTQGEKTTIVVLGARLHVFTCSVWFPMSFC